MLSSQINYRDPRFMRMLQQEQAARPYAAIPTRGAATRAFVNQQEAKNLAFARIGLQSKIAADNLKYNYKVLDYQKKQAGKEIDARKNAMYGTLGMGALTGIYSALQGKYQSDQLMAQALQQQKFNNDLLDLQRQILTFKQRGA